MLQCAPVEVTAQLLHRQGASHLLLLLLLLLQVLDVSGSGLTERGLPCLQTLAGSLSVLKLRGCQVGWQQQQQSMKHDSMLISITPYISLTIAPLTPLVALLLNNFLLLLLLLLRSRLVTAPGLLRWGS
jgi:hypothetical protein